MDSIALQPHPAARPGAIDGVDVLIRRDGRLRLRVDYAVRGDLGRLHLPPHAGLERADELWKTTCFELFVIQGAGGYMEFNVSPSGQWAAYAFDGYRSGMAPVPGSPVLANEATGAGLTATFDLEAVGQGALRLGVSAVIEEVDGTKSYWALVHPSDKPDFHHPDSFVLELP